MNFVYYISLHCTNPNGKKTEVAGSSLLNPINASTSKIRTNGKFPIKHGIDKTGGEK